MFSIGELSTKTGVKVVTLRFYEQSKLLDEPPRTAGGRRLYDEEDVERVEFILAARELGFEIEEVRELIALGKGTTGGTDEAAPVLARYIEAVERRLRRLETLRAALSQLRDPGEAIRGGKILQAMKSSGN